MAWLSDDFCSATPISTNLCSEFTLGGVGHGVIFPPPYVQDGANAAGFRPESPVRVELDMSMSNPDLSIIDMDNVEQLEFRCVNPAGTDTVNYDIDPILNKLVDEERRFRSDMTFPER